MFISNQLSLLSRTQMYFQTDHHKIMHKYTTPFPCQLSHEAQIEGLLVVVKD